MLKIDGHQHFWNLQKLPLPWLKPQNEVLYRNYEATQLGPLLVESGVDGAVAVQAAHDEAETSWLLELTHQYPFIKGVVGHVELAAPDLAERLEKFKEQGPFCGTRYPLLVESNGEISLDRAAANGLKTLAEADLACDLLIRWDRLQNLEELFEAGLEVRWVINHLAQPPFKTGAISDWQAALQKVARYPNVFCKVSGMVTQADPAKNTQEQVRPFFEQTLEMFGPERLLWGSDWPVSLQAAAYRQVHDLLASLVAELSPGEQAAIWGETATRAYKIKGDKFS